MAGDDEAQEEQHAQGPKGLVPMYVGRDVDRGIQAFRRGDMILYTVRGEPDEVQELVGELNKRGVNEVVALISHQSFEEQDEEEEPAREVERDDDAGS